MASRIERCRKGVALIVDTECAEIGLRRGLRLTVEELHQLTAACRGASTRLAFLTPLITHAEVVAPGKGKV